jgi:O-antigen ligase
MLVTSIGAALVAFAGLLPSIHSVASNVVIASVAVGISLVVALCAAGGLARVKVSRAVLLSVAAVAAIGCGLGLHDRIFDAGSNDGRLELWRQGIQDLKESWIFGQGPWQSAEASRGHLTMLFIHNDLLQFGTYFGLAGFLGMAIVGYLVVSALARSRTTVSRELWGIAFASCLAVGLVAMVDFPLQIPVVQVILSFIIGVVIQPGSTSSTREIGMS